MTAGPDERPVMQDVGQGYKIWANSPVTTVAGQAGQGDRAEAGETCAARGGDSLAESLVRRLRTRMDRQGPGMRKAAKRP
jgi:hypothetical protein